MLDPVAPAEDEPDAVVVARETIELAYLAAIQYLPPRQRAILILQDSPPRPQQRGAFLIRFSDSAFPRLDRYLT